ncbi:Ig-like domain-containing protein [Nocardioides flavescens]|uniref:Fibronectin type-III domain-containing protein n=1 Tax=Nocardioides flavescens TaxID=2691959 RepID=A0A6L7EVZ4_9ACTN|nr:Ig-like domain-containing protein [Nocardioides flavescens]MXG90890.1 hypothetical protein [Nocardioides flavescens]
MSPFAPVARVLGTLRRPALRRVASATTLAAVTTTLVVLAVRADGTPVSEVDLNDGGVWVTNQSGASAPMIGRLNRQVSELDLGVVAPGSRFDVFQTETTVLADVSPFDPLDGVEPDLELRQIVPIDVASGTLRDAVELTPTTMARYGGRVVALVDTKGGSAWVRSVDNLAGFSQQATDPDLELGTGGRFAVQPDGVVLALDPQDAELTQGEVGVDGVVTLETPIGLGEPLSAESDLTAVGGHGFVFDRAAGSLVTGPSTRVDVEEPAGLTLQQPAARGDRAYVATNAGLYTVDAGGESLKRVDTGVLDGGPAAPVVDNGCVYAAWADPDVNGFYRDCDGSVTRLPIPGVAENARLVFRTNRGYTVLNDVASGAAWMIEDGTLEKIQNWTDIDPRIEDRTERREQIDTTERTEENHDPDARDDDLGARAGQPTVLPVTSNDRDPDGDVLTVATVKSIGGVAPQIPVQVVGSGTQLQVQFPADAAGQTAQLNYTVSDGRQGEDEATVTVRIRSAEENTAPQPLDPDVALSADVSRGASVQAYVLPAFVDPEGDDLVLDDARIDPSQGEVDFRSDGTLTFHDSGSSTGIKNVSLSISDGRLAYAATLPVTVTAGKALPALVADHVTVTAGQATTVEPLRNDASPDGSSLGLASVGKQPGIQLTRRPDGQSFTLVATGVQSYYLPYKAYNDSGTAESFIRVDVLNDATENRPPTAVKDQAVLTGGGSVLVDVLANDFDPDGDVLVVPEVSAPQGIKASLVDKHMLRIQTTRELTGVERIDYVVSDGLASSTGSVSVIARDEAGRNRAPQAVDDRVRIRAGAVGTVAVLANDSDPDGDALSLLQSELVVPDQSMIAFVSGRQVRLRAPEEPGQYQLQYGVRDPGGRGHSATVRIKVLPDTAVDNSPPNPEPIQARAISEQTTRVQIRTAGSDPDGDAVSLKGIARAPQKGRIVQSGLDWFSYESFPDSFGTDVFQVTVADKYGAEAIVDVRIGIAPRAADNQAPVAFDDDLVVRPDRTIEYGVLANDVDVDGDALSVAADLEAPAGVDASVRDGLVTVPAPKPDGTGVARTSVGYTVADGLGGTDTAYLTVTADESAPLYAPITRDDAADLAEIAGKKPGDTVSVDVLRNDGDIDGARSELSIQTLDPTVSRVRRGEIEVTLAASDQVLAYQVTDADGQFSYGFLFVGGTDTVPPVLDPGAALPVEVVSGSSVQLPLADYVLVRAGRQPRLTTAGEVEANKSDSSKLVVDPATLRFAAEPGYVGAAAIIAEVTDGNGVEGAYLDDPTRLTSRLTIPIEVLPADNLPPTMRSGVLTVDGSGESTTTVDLANFADDPNAEDREGLSFAAVGGGDDLEISQDGSVLEVTGTGAARTPRKPVVVTTTVTDPGGLSATGTLKVRVLPTTRPLVTVRPIERDAQQGDTVTVDVADYATNPIPGEPLRVTGVGVDSSEGPQPAVSSKGSEVVIRTDPSMSGTAVVRFQVNDGLGDPARAVAGLIRVTVTGPPEAPSRPTVTGVSSGTATLSWREPVDNGSPVTSYEIRGSRGYSRTCPLTSCTLDDLQNGQEYAFNVTAVNDVGRSEPSPDSEAVVPDEVPGDVPGLTVVPTKKDGELQLTWGDPVNEGSEVERFELRSRGGATPQSLPRGSHAYTWAGLSNTTQYSFSIRAVNAEGPGEWSAQTEAVNPFGPPKPSASAPQGATQNDGQLGGSVTVEWEAADDNGNPVTGYDVEVYEDGKLTRTVPQPATARSLPLNASNGVGYSFRVRASNAAGPGEWTGTSAPVTPYGRATEPRNAKAADQDQKAQLTWDPPADLRGTTLDHYEVTGPSGTRSTTSPSLVYDFGANAGPYAVTIVPITKAPDGSKLVTGDATRVEGIRPFGKPSDPTVQVNQNGVSGTFSWNSAASANGRPIAKTVITVDGSSRTVSGPDSGSVVVSGDGGERHTVSVEVVAEAGGQSSAGTSFTAPGTNFTVSKGGATTTGYCTAASCATIVVDLVGLRPGSYTMFYNTDCNTQNRSACLGGNNGGAAHYQQEQVNVGESGSVHFAGRAFGYPGAAVWIDINGRDSNRITW